MRAISDQISMADAVPSKSGIPDDEKVWVSYYGVDGRRRYVLTSRIYRDKYFLYAVYPNGSVMRLGECSSPIQLEQRFKVLEEIAKAK